MLNKFVISAAALAVASVAAPASATIIVPGTAGLTYSPFVVSSQGTLIASTSVPGTALTFSAVMRSAVYLNTFGTLDFYYQVARTGAGTVSSQMIDAFTASDFAGYTVDALVSAADLDGERMFTASNNPPGSTTTVGRSSTGVTMQTNFGTNGLENNEVSATYIFRTNARSFTTGTFGVIDGSSYSGLAYAPAGPAVPEPATWAMMLVGFGMTGAAIRYRRRKTNVTYA
jgi:hypothetical protein